MINIILVRRKHSLHIILSQRMYTSIGFFQHGAIIGFTKFNSIFFADCVK